MIHLVLAALWDSAFAQFGLAGIVLIGAVAVFLWVPGSGARHVAVAVASVCVIFLFLAPKLYIEGIRHEKAKWDAAEAAAAQRGADARVAAERQIAEREVAEREAAKRDVAQPPAEAGDGDAGRGIVRRIFHPHGVRRHDANDRDDP